MPKRLPLGRVTKTYVGQWLDDRRIAFSGFEPDRPMRAFVQDVEDGTIRPVTPEGMDPSMFALVVPGGEFVLAGSSGERWLLFPIDGGDPRPLSISDPGMPVAWSGDGRSLYVAEFNDYRTARKVYRVDVSSGRRELWKTLGPPDSAGIESIGPIVLTPDASSYCYTYTRTLGTLSVVEGLR